MAGMLNEILARQRAQDLSRRAAEKRRGAGPRAERPRAQMLRSLLGRRHFGLLPRRDATGMRECPRDC
jgi:hypothetical protein